MEFNHSILGNVCVVGAGYVGLSLAVLIAQKYNVTVIDISEDKVNMINKLISPLKDELLEKYLREKELSLEATTQADVAYAVAEYIIIATPTNYDELTKKFDTRSVEAVISEVIKVNPQAYIIIKSTVHVRFTRLMSLSYDSNRIIYSPEFLRETFALYDNLYPSRIITGIVDGNELQKHIADSFSKLLLSVSNKSGITCLMKGSSEAESVKLFSNTYLALRISFLMNLIHMRN